MAKMSDGEKMIWAAAYARAMKDGLGSDLSAQYATQIAYSLASVRPTARNGGSMVAVEEMRQ